MKIEGRACHILSTGNITSFEKEKASADSAFPSFTSNSNPCLGSFWEASVVGRGRGKMALEWHAHTLHHPSLFPSCWAQSLD